jgi:REP element-mobilizing transposase RayT
MIRVSKRRLPHWQAGGSTYFLTFRLSGYRSSGGFADYKSAPRRLDAAERRIVKDAILFWHAKRWTVHALTAMPDHVHILATPLQAGPGAWHSLSKLVQSVKRHAAREINRHRRTRGAVWQAESFDRIVRDEREFHDKFTYIIGNAVKAEVAKDGWEYDGFWCEGKQWLETRAAAPPP